MTPSDRQPDPAMWHGNIPLSILFDPNATQNVKLVYVVINAKAGASRWWNATHESIALACGWKASSRKTVTTALAYLESIGAIVATKRINPANGHHAATRYDVQDWRLIKTEWSPMGSSTTLENRTEQPEGESQCGPATPPMWSGDTSNVVEEPQLTNAPTNVPTNDFNYNDADASCAENSYLDTHVDEVIFSGHELTIKDLPFTHRLTEWVHQGKFSTLTEKQLKEQRLLREWRPSTHYVNDRIVAHAARALRCSFSAANRWVGDYINEGVDGGLAGALRALVVGVDPWDALGDAQIADAIERAIAEAADDVELDKLDVLAEVWPRSVLGVAWPEVRQPGSAA